MIASSDRVYVQRNCAWCEGAKTLVLAPGHTISCVVCGGKGHVKVIESAIQCAACKGVGRRDNTRSCFLCDGTGWARV